jgi:hypothetical protein
MSLAPFTVAQAADADPSKSTATGRLQKLLDRRAQLQEALERTPVPEAALGQTEAAVAFARLNANLAKLGNQIRAEQDRIVAANELTNQGIYRVFVSLS